MEQVYGLSLNAGKCEPCFLGPNTSTQYSSIQSQFPENCFSKPKLLYFFADEPLFLHNDFIDLYEKLLKISLYKVTNVKMDDNQFLHVVLLAAKSRLGVSSARLLALSAFLASAVGAKKALSKIFGLEHGDGI